MHDRDFLTSRHGNRLAAALLTFRNGLFGSFFVLQRKVTPRAWLTVLGQAIAFFQMMQFALRQNVGFPWLEDSVSVLRAVVGASSVVSLLNTGMQNPSSPLPSPALPSSLFFSSLLWVLLFSALQLWGAAAFIRGEIPVIWPLRLLRLVANFSATVAYIPLFSILLSVFRCGEEGVYVFAWSEQGMQCFAGAHLALCIISAIAAALLTILCALFALFFYDSHVLSTNLAAKVHGRVELLHLCTRACLVIALDVVPNRLGPAANTALLLLAGLASLAALLWCMPYTFHSMNQWRVAAACMYTWTVVALIIAQLYPGFDAAVLVYAGMPLAAGCGVALASARRSCILHARTPIVMSPYDAELRVRYMLQQAVQDIRYAARSRNAAAAVIVEAGQALKSHSLTRTGRNMTRMGAPVTMTLMRVATAESSKDDAKYSPAKPSYRPLGNHDATMDPLTLPDGAHSCMMGSPTASMFSAGKKAAPAGLHISRPGGTSTRTRAGSVLSAMSPSVQATPQVAPLVDDASWEMSFDRLDADARAAVIRTRIPTEVREQLLTFYKDAIMRFPTSAILQVFVARYYDVVFDSRQQQMGHLLQAMRLKPPLDVAFLAYQARRHLESHVGTGILSALTRVSLEKYLADAKRFVYRAAAAQAYFWSSLLAQPPRLASLHKWSKRLTECSGKAEDAFAEIFALDPQSIIGLRLLAQYHLAVSNNPEKAAEIVAEAERVEDMRAKEHQSYSSINQHFGLRFFKDTTIDVHADNVAIITIGATPRDLGIMQSANGYACRLFGFSRNQLLRQNLNMLLPSPIAEMHDSFLRRYLATGDGKFVDMSRVMFGKHKSGSIFPVLLSVRESPAEDGIPSFVGFMRPLSTPDHYLLLNSKFTITALDAASASAIGLDPYEAACGDVHIGDFINDWYSVLEALEHQAQSSAPTQGIEIEFQSANISSSSDSDDDVAAQSLPAYAAAGRRGSNATEYPPSARRKSRGVTNALAQLQTVKIAGTTIYTLVWYVAPVKPAYVSPAHSGDGQMGILRSMSMFRQARQHEAGESGIRFSNVNSLSKISEASASCEASVVASPSIPSPARSPRLELPNQVPSPSFTLPQIMMPAFGQVRRSSTQGINSTSSTPGRSPSHRGNMPSVDAEMASSDKTSLPNTTTDSADVSQPTTPGLPKSPTENPILSPSSVTFRGAASMLTDGKPGIASRGSRVQVLATPLSAGSRQELLHSGSHNRSALSLHPMNRHHSIHHKHSDVWQAPNSNVDDRNSQMSMKSYGKKIHIRLRRALQDHHKHTMLPVLRWLWRLGVCTVIINIVLMIVAAVLLASAMRTVEDTLDLNAVSEALQEVLVTTELSIIRSKFQQNGWQPVPDVLPTNVVLGSVLDLQRQLHSYLQALGKLTAFSGMPITAPDVASIIYHPFNSLSASDIAIKLQDPAARLASMADGSLAEYSTKRSTLMLVLQDCSALLSLAANQMQVGIVEASPAGLFFRQLGSVSSTLLPVLQNVQDSAYDTAAERHIFMRNMAVGLIATVGLALVMLIGIAYLPILVIVEKYRNDILVRFRQIPQSVVTMLKRLSEKRVKRLYSDEDSGEFSSSDGSGADQRNNPLGAADDLNGVPEDGDDDFGDNTGDGIDWMGLMMGPLSPGRTCSMLSTDCAPLGAGSRKQQFSSTGSRATSKYVSLVSPSDVKAAPALQIPVMHTDVTGHPPTSTSIPKSPQAAKNRDTSKAIQTCSRNSLLSVLKVLLPSVCMLAFYLTSYAVTVPTSSDCVALLGLYQDTAQRRFFFRQGVVATFKAITLAGYDSENRAAIRDASDSWALLNTYHSSLAFGLGVPVNASLLGYWNALDHSGNELDGFNVLDAASQEDIRVCMFRDSCACLGAACAAYGTAELPLTGIHSSLTAIRTRALAALTRRSRATVPLGSAYGAYQLGNTTQNYSIPYEVEALSGMLNMSDHVVIPALTSLANVHKRTFSSELTRYYRFILAFTLLFSIFLIGLLMVIYLPTVRAIDRDLHSKRAMLLLLPPPVLATIPAIRQVVTRIIHETGHHKTGASAAHVADGLNDDSSPIVGFIPNGPSDADQLAPHSTEGHPESLLSGGLGPVTGHDVHRQFHGNSNLRNQVLFHAADQM